MTHWRGSPRGPDGTAFCSLHSSGMRAGACWAFRQLISPAPPKPLPIPPHPPTPTPHHPPPSLSSLPPPYPSLLPPHSPSIPPHSSPPPSPPLYAPDWGHAHGATSKHRPVLPSGGSLPNCQQGHCVLQGLDRCSHVCPHALQFHRLRQCLDAGHWGGAQGCQLAHKLPQEDDTLVARVQLLGTGWRGRDGASIPRAPHGARWLWTDLTTSTSTSSPCPLPPLCPYPPSFPPATTMGFVAGAQPIVGASSKRCKGTHQAQLPDLVL
jgi:hypothetical protein